MIPFIAHHSAHLALLVAVGLSSVVTLNGFAAGGSYKSDSAGESNRPFSPGEKLDFKVYFEFILGGDATMEVAPLEEVNGRLCYRFTSTARSTRTVDKFYKVRDRIESWREIDGGSSRRYFKQLREGKWVDDKVVEYFQEDSLALLQKKAGAPIDTLRLTPPVQDVLSAFYYFRECSLTVGQSVRIPLHDIDKQYILEVRALRKERIEVPAGTFDCIVVEPLLKSSGIFRREGSLHIWLTDDHRRMPVLMQSKLYFGRVWAKLVDYKLGGE